MGDTMFGVDVSEPFPRMMSTKEVSDALKMSESSIRVLVKRGVLIARRVGVRKLGIDRESVAAYLAARPNAADGG